jgi:hypothetical protein
MGCHLFQVIQLTLDFTPPDQNGLVIPQQGKIELFYLTP